MGSALGSGSGQGVGPGWGLGLGKGKGALEGTGVLGSVTSSRQKGSPKRYRRPYPKSCQND